MNIVWFKKDLRVEDHQPLAEAIETGPSVGLFIFEPEWYQSPEFSLIHLQFAHQSLEDLKNQLLKKRVSLIIRNGSAVDVFQDLQKQKKIKMIFSHQETGLDWTFKRDIKIKHWTKENNIRWFQFKQFAVVRKLKDRSTWNAKRINIIERPIKTCPVQDTLITPYLSDTPPFEKLSSISNRLNLLKGGSSIAQQLLNSFLENRGENYFRSISSPLKAFKACSRLSPYITWGNISLTAIHQALLLKKKSLSDSIDFMNWKLSLKQFENRLWWHCHFIQKLESEPEIEFENFNREFNGLRENEFDEMKFHAWCKGETGFPMIDACMRALHTYGWINFRMRAMLISFASYQLWLHWKKPAEYLAQQFLDFEPGIHYSQIQMQSGVTGINAIRIYSPKKQLLDQDPNGLFIKKFIPELALVPISDLAEPHLMPPLLQMETNYKIDSTYPKPIVDPEQSYQQAKKRIFEVRNFQSVRNESEKVLKKHASRAGLHFPYQKRSLSNT